MTLFSLGRGICVCVCAEVESGGSRAPSVESRVREAALRTGQNSSTTVSAGRREDLFYEDFQPNISLSILDF